MADDGRIAYDDTHMQAVSETFDTLALQSGRWKTQLAAGTGSPFALASGPPAWAPAQEYGVAWSEVLSSIATRIAALTKDAEDIRVAMQALQSLTAENETLTTLTAADWALAFGSPSTTTT